MFMKRLTVKLISLLLLSAMIVPFGACNKEKDPEPVPEEKMYSTEKLFSIVPQPKEVKLEGDKSNYVIYNLKPAISTADEAFAQYAATFIGYETGCFPQGGRISHRLRPKRCSPVCIG